MGKWKKSAKVEHELRMIPYFLSVRCTHREVMELLGISRATFYRRLTILKPAAPSHEWNMMKARAAIEELFARMEAMHRGRK